MKLTVNGEARDFDAPARTHLADLLREHFGLTGTHLGCEQGVCGACTVLLDGAPARACLLYAHEAAGSDVTTIEGLDDDPIAAALRAAFTKHHALQCGYCTPGMMVTAVDIVQRLGAVDEARIREELAGNLCRCTGYRGIVRAIAEVAAGQTARLARVDTPPPATPTPRPTSATHGLPTIAPVPPAVMAGPDPAISQPRGTLHAEAHNATDLPHRITHRQAIALPLEEAWARLSDPARAAACLPGAQLTRHEGDALEGEIVVALGPITTRLAGTGTLRLDAATHTARMTGQGRDGGNTARGEIAWRLTPAVEGCVLHLDIGWRLTGPLAQFSRPALLRGLVTAIAAEFAHNLATGAQAARPGLLSLFRLWWRGLFSR